MLRIFVILLGLLVWLPSSAVTADVLCVLGKDGSAYKANVDQRPTADAMDLAGRVNKALQSMCAPNCPSMVLFRNATAPNAILTVESGQAKMAYAPEFFTVVYEKHGDGAIIAFIAHVLGHAINETAPAAWMKDDWAPELRADAWAGCALGKTGLSAVGLGHALSALSLYPSPAHPRWPARIPALRLGYTRCGGDGSKFDSQVDGNKLNPR